MTPSLLIVGSGAMATLFAGRLVASGVDVTILGTWEESLQALRTHGVRILNFDDKEDSYPVRVADNPSDCRDSKYALVLVKSWQTQRAAKQLADCLRLA